MSDYNLSSSKENRKSLLNILNRIIRIICRTGLNIATVFLIVDTVLIGLNVFLRYVFHISLMGAEEFVSASLTIIVMLSAPEVLRKSNHIGVDILTGLLTRKKAKIASVWSSITVLFVSIVLFTNGWKAMQLSKMIGSLTEGYLEIPVWSLQLFLPIGGLLLGLVAIEQIIKTLKKEAPNQNSIKVNKI